MLIRRILPLSKSVGGICGQPARLGKNGHVRERAICIMLRLFHSEQRPGQFPQPVHLQ